MLSRSNSSTRELMFTLLIFIVAALHTIVYQAMVTPFSSLKARYLAITNLKDRVMALVKF